MRNSRLDGYTSGDWIKMFKEKYMVARKSTRPAIQLRRVLKKMREKII